MDVPRPRFTSDLEEINWRAERIRQAQRIAEDYPRLCRMAWLVCRADWEVEACIEELRSTLQGLRVVCRCDPPGSGEEHCTGHCEQGSTS